MTGSSSKLLQIQGRWYRERKPKKHSKTWGKKKQNLFYTRFLIMDNEFIIRLVFFKHIHRQVAVRLHKATGGSFFFFGGWNLGISPLD